MLKKTLKASKSPVKTNGDDPGQKNTRTRKKRGTVERTDTRSTILDATEQIMLEDGYAAVSSRRVGKEAGLKSQLLHYYFRTMDDLFIAVFQRMSERFRERFARAVTSDQPFLELWKLNKDPASTGLLLEFVALATHRKAIRTLIARSTRQDRSMHVAALTQIMERFVITSEDLSPTLLTLLIGSVAHKLITEKALGVSEGHAEMIAFVERHLCRLEALPRRQASLEHTTPKDGPQGAGRAKPQAAPRKSRRMARTVRAG